MAIKEAAAAIIQSGKMVLLTRRKQGENLLDIGSFPGKKIRESETIQECLKPLFMLLGIWRNFLIT